MPLICDALDGWDRMSIRIPVKTQVPVETTQFRNSIRRTIRYQQLNIGGTARVIHTVPQGFAHRIICIELYLDVAQPSAADCRVDVQMKNSNADYSNNVVWRKFLPDLTNAFMFVTMSPFESYSSYDVTKGLGGNTYRMVAIPIPDVILINGEKIQFDAYSFGANDDMTIQITFEEYSDVI